MYTMTPPADKHGKYAKEIADYEERYNPLERADLLLENKLPPGAVGADD